MINCASSSRYGINFAASGDTQGVALANTILGAATASVNSAAPDTCFIGTGPYQASTLPRVINGTYTLVANDNVILLETTGQDADAADRRGGRREAVHDQADRQRLGDRRHHVERRPSTAPPLTAWPTSTAT